jgi:hypothetical protein
MDFNINLDGLDFGNFDFTDFASSLDFNLEDDILNASLSGKRAEPYYSDYEYSNAPLQKQEWFKPKYKNILNSFFEGQAQSIGAAFTADNARMAVWHDAQKALNSGADPDKVFNALRTAGNKSEAKLIEENITNKRKLAGKKVGSTGQFESLVVDSARENLNTFNSNLRSTLQSNPDSFNSQFNALPTNGKLSFLHHQYKQGDLPKDKYEEAYIATVNSAYDPDARNTPVFVEVEGKVYLNPNPRQTNKTADELLEPDFYNVDKWSAAGGSENAIGVRITGERTDDFDASGFGKFLQDFSVFRAPLALVTGGLSEAIISGVAGLSGETLHAGDWLNLAAAGYDLANTPETVPTEPDIFDPIDDGIATIDLDGVPLDITAGGSVFDSFDEDEQPEIEIIETAPSQVETIQELPDAPEAEQEPIEADPIDEVITQPTLPEVVEQKEAAAGSGQEDILLRQTYEAVLEGSVPIEEYIRMGGRFVDELRANTPYEEVYAPYEEPVVGGEPVELDETGEPVQEDDDIFIPDIDFFENIEESAFDVGTGDGTGTGYGTGTGEGTGEGDGTGEGTGTGADTGLGFGSATRTTDSLFGDMLQLKTQVGSTQERLRPFSMAPVPSIMRYDVPPVDPIQQFLQQQETQRLRNKPQGMLTNAEILKRFPY